LAKYQRRKSLAHYLQSYPALNTGVQNANYLCQDIEHLIKQKNRLFPQVKKPIMHTEIRGEVDRVSISAVSMRTE
jgi:hypothetical protein